MSRGMVVDFAVHQPDREDGGIPNPHFHVLCPIRPIEQNGKWGLKQRRVYELDEDGNLLCDKADDFYGGRLPVHVRLILDEFANIGQIPNFDKLIATIRSREISASIILQSQSQLKTIYKDAADTIVGNCDSTLFLGGKEKSTLKEISELLGKETIDLYNQSENRGSQISHGLSYQKLGKELMSQDELAVMDGGKCIYMLRGVRPFLSEKYDLTKHPNYKYTADADPKNVFDMERYTKKQRAVVKPTDTFEVYEINITT